MDRPYGASDYGEMNRRASASVTDVSNVVALHQSTRMCSVCQRRDVSRPPVLAARIEITNKEGAAGRITRADGGGDNENSSIIARCRRDRPGRGTCFESFCPRAGPTAPRDGWAPAVFFSLRPPSGTGRLRETPGSVIAGSSTMQRSAGGG